MRKKYRVILTNPIVLYTRSTYFEPYQNDLKYFGTKIQFWLVVWRTNQITVYATLWSLCEQYLLFPGRPPPVFTPTPNILNYYHNHHFTVTPTTI